MKKYLLAATLLAATPANANVIAYYTGGGPMNAPYPAVLTGSITFNTPLDNLDSLAGLTFNVTPNGNFELNCPVFTPAASP